jgi:phosphate acyltransferase
MNIAVDAMGGDYAPREVVIGAFHGAVEHDISVLLVGDRPRIERELAPLGDHGGRIEVVHAEESVGMEETPTVAVRRKKRSSVRICAELVREGRAQALISAGNTGAVMIAAKMVLGTIPGIDRPALVAEFPNPRGRTVVLDVGANVDSRSAHLRQFAVMGHFYAQEIHGKASPRIGVMSIGEEDTKGTDMTREVVRVLKGTGLHFVGNVEGRDVFNGAVDVIVCDGFVGNVILKSAESMAELVKAMLRRELRQSFATRIGGWLARPALQSFSRLTDYREYGSVPLLGLNGGCFIAHGRSNSRAIRNSIRRAAEFAEAKMHEKIGEKVAQLHSQEERWLGLTGAASNRDGDD